MVERLIRGFRTPGLLLGLLLLPSPALAHRLDEYLQATLVAIEPSQVRLQINLTPGVEVADKVLMHIDRDGDGTISPLEAWDYCELLKCDLILRLDGSKVPLKLSASNFPAPSELRTGWGIVQLEFSAPIGPLAAGAHKLTLKNRHLPRISVYLFNAAPPASPLIQISAQKRNRNQSSGEIRFGVER